MSFPPLFGGGLSTRGIRIPGPVKVNIGMPGSKVSARTPPFVPGTPLPNVSSPDSTDDSNDDSQDQGSGLGSNPPLSPTLKQPPMTEGMRQEQALIDNPPAPAGGIRGKIGGALNAIGWNWAGNPLKYPGLDVYQGNLARAQAKSQLEDEALKRQEAMERIKESQENQRATRDLRQQNLDLSKQNAYARQMGDIEKAGGFEAPNIPPEIQSQQIPMSPQLTQIPGSGSQEQPSNTDIVKNLPQNSPLLIPGMTPQQSSSLGTVQSLKDPSTGEVRNMVRPNLKTQAEMRQVDAPQDILDFYKNLPPDFTKQYPVTPPTIPANGKISPEEAKRLETKYQRDSTALQSWNAQRNKPEKMDQVALAIKAAGGDPNNPATVTPDIAAKAVAKLKQQQPGIDLTPEAIQYWAQAAAAGIPLPSMGMGASGAKARQAIINAAPGAAPRDTAGTPVPLAAAAATRRADTASLTSAQKMRDSVVAFEKTASKNLDLFTNQAKKVMDSGSPWINQPLRTIDRNALGSADQAAFDAARQVALTEIAKVVNNPSLSSVLSDTARKEVLSLNPENATLAQINSVANVLKQDMANRRTSLDAQIAEIKGRMNPSASQAKPDPLGIR